MNTISHANHLGERRPATRPVMLDHSHLFHFPYPSAGTFCCRPSNVITPPPAYAIRVVGDPIPDKKANPQPKKPTAKREFVRTPGIQAEIDRRLRARIEKYEPAMKGKGWLTATQIGIRVRSSGDTVRSVLKRMIGDGQVEGWKKSPKEVLYRWVSANALAQGRGD